MKNNQMKISFFILSVMVSFFACVPSKELPLLEYELLPKNTNLNRYIGKKIYFKAQFCEFEMQHMLRFTLNEANQHFCIDQINDDFQMLAYTDQSKIEKIKKYDGKVFTIYGTLNSIAGAGKGGGEHTEYYLEFDKLELNE